MAPAQLLDDFESYTPGDLCGQSAWDEWPDRRGRDACGTVTQEQSRSGTRSLKIVGDPGGKFGFGDHVVWRTEIFGGLWTASIWTFLPDSASGTAQVILWDDRELTHTSVRILLDADNDIVVSEPGGEAMPLVRGRWIELRAEFDLGPRTVNVFYDNFALASNEFWRGGHRIEAVSIYGGEPGAGTSGIYVDDLLFDPIDTCEPCDMNCNGEINALDIEPFLEPFGPPPCSPCVGDTNRDGVINALDIEPFLVCLFGPNL